MTAALMSHKRLRVPAAVTAAAAAFALALVLGDASSGSDDPIAAPAESAQQGDPYQDRTGTFPGPR